MRFWPKALLVAWLTGVIAPCGLRAGPASADSALFRSLHYRLEVAPGVPASFITVGVTNEVVTLNGAVDNLLARKRAEAIAATTPGVSAVHNQIVILPAERNDWEVRAGVADALSVAPALKNDKIDPEVRDGFVTLTGKVGSWTERHLAELTAEGVNGVRGVDNKLRVTYGTPRSDAEIMADIRSELKWDPWLTSPEVKLEVHDGTVHLTGLVASSSAGAYTRTPG